MKQSKGMLLPFAADSLTKHCSKCRTVKPLTDFYFYRPGKLSAHCRQCHNAYSREYNKNTQRWKSQAYKAWKKRNLEHLKAYRRAQYRKFRERAKEKMKKHVEKIKSAALAHYGNKCACCGEARRTMLDMDHVFGGGNVERRLQGGDTLHVYRKVWRAGRSLPEYQPLCCNCNHSKRRNGGSCEHKTEEIDVSMAACP